MRTEKKIKKQLAALEARRNSTQFEGEKANCEALIKKLQEELQTFLQEMVDVIDPSNEGPYTTPEYEEFKVYRNFFYRIEFYAMACYHSMEKPRDLEKMLMDLTVASISRPYNSWKFQNQFTTIQYDWGVRVSRKKIPVSQLECCVPIWYIALDLEKEIKKLRLRLDKEEYSMSLLLREDIDKKCNELVGYLRDLFNYVDSK